MQADDTHFSLNVDSSHTGTRLDQFVAVNCDCSRKRATALIKKGAVTVNDKTQKPSCKLTPGDTVSGYLPQAQPIALLPEPIPLTILFEDDHLLIINKAPGIVTHPAPGHPAGTLVNGLLHYYPAIAHIGDPDRPGIVHRLDQDTSGVMIIAKAPAAFEKLSAMFADRRISKTYLTVIYGHMKGKSGIIDLPIGRHAAHRKKMTTVNSVNPREALTLWKVRKTFDDASLLEVDIKTGRTHQIRVHCTAMGTPVVGDPVYAARWTQKKKHFSTANTFEILQAAPRQMLHAWRLEFSHPVTEAFITAKAPLPQDFVMFLRQLSQQKG